MIRERAFFREHPELAVHPQAGIGFAVDTIEGRGSTRPGATGI